MVRITDTTDLRVPELPDAENEMSHRYLRMIEQWIPTGVAYFSNWPDDRDGVSFYRRPSPSTSSQKATHFRPT